MFFFLFCLLRSDRLLTFFQKKINISVYTEGDEFARGFEQRMKFNEMWIRMHNESWMMNREAKVILQATRGLPSYHCETKMNVNDAV